MSLVIPPIFIPLLREARKGRCCLWHKQVCCAGGAARRRWHQMAGGDRRGQHVAKDSCVTYVRS